MSRPNLLVLGGSGQLGQAIQEHPSVEKYTISAPSSGALDIRDANGLSAFVSRTSPLYVVNCAAYTAVDRAESEPALAYSINSGGARNVARTCAVSGAHLIHLSTDFVFGGNSERPYVETDQPGPLNVYGASKLQGERLVIEENPRSCILRVSWLFGLSSSSFVGKILDRALRGEPLRVVDDQRGSPTSAAGVADVIFRLIEAPRWTSGVYHYCESPDVTWFDFAKEIIRQATHLGILRAGVDVAEISSAELSAAARRARYAVLDASALTARLGIVQGAWPDRLGEVLESIARHAPAAS